MILGESYTTRAGGSVTVRSCVPSVRGSIFFNRFGLSLNEEHIPRFVVNVSS
jgi:hypothetical protein